MLQNEIFIPESIKLCLSKRFFSAPSMSSCFTMPSLVVVVDGGGDCCGDASYSCVVVEMRNRAFGDIKRRGI
ncbi:hypothetical protein NC653_032618 [Populus alba x Populus x berolinensis]|uniref:Uncharacterized protein n=1 Tax=Populus alba x Populus x berolinensis TaxID=444605 RepID=A0AAD6PZB6_9ROSI|nr:hypothetical protein NC653_032618 [Populus alba x Populus x berolinensis]